MGTMRHWSTITSEYAADIGDVYSRDAYVRQLVIGSVTQQGLTPVGEPVLDWHEITEDDVLTEMARLRRMPSFRAGDWHVTGTIEVAEDAPEPEYPPPFSWPDRKK